MKTAAAIAPQRPAERPRLVAAQSDGDTLERTVALLCGRVARLEMQIERLLAGAAGQTAPAVKVSREDQLRLAAADLGIAVSIDGHVAERDAARLLNRSPSTLRGWRRYYDRDLRYRRLGNRIEYALEDLADLLERE